MAQFKGLQGAYSSKSIIRFAVRNLERQKILVNVSVEALNSAGWNEIVASVTDKKHPYGKALRLTSIEVGASLAVSYKPMGAKGTANPVKRAELPISLRLRVDVFDADNGTVIQQVRSEPFQLTAVQ